MTPVERHAELASAETRSLFEKALLGIVHWRLAGFHERSVSFFAHSDSHRA